MEIITNILNHNLDIDEYFDSNSCFMDIETTGLKRDKDIIYLVGILYKNNNDWILNQYFLNNLENEDIMIKSIIKSINKFDNIITYNGDSFDIPFINKRAIIYGLEEFINKDKSKDLYRYIKQNKAYLNLSNLKLKTVEESLGFFREDIYSGYDCIKFYKNYIVNNDIKYKNIVLKHNFDDLIHMLDIVEIIDVVREKKTILLNIDNSIYAIYLDEIKFEKDTMKINGSLNKPIALKIVNYNQNYNLLIDDKFFSFSIETQKGYIEPEVLCNFINLENFHFNLLNKKSQYYNIPSFIYPFKIDKTILVEEIKNFLKPLLKNITI